MEKGERIENFLKEWKDGNDEIKNYYIRYREWVNPDGNVEEMDFFDELENLLTNLNIKYKYTNVAYFEIVVPNSNSANKKRQKPQRNVFIYIRKYSRNVKPINNNQNNSAH